MIKNKAETCILWKTQRIHFEKIIKMDSIVLNVDGICMKLFNHTTVFFVEY